MSFSHKNVEISSIDSIVSDFWKKLGLKTVHKNVGFCFTFLLRTIYIVTPFLSGEAGFSSCLRDLSVW